MKLNQQIPKNIAQINRFYKWLVWIILFVTFIPILSCDFRKQNTDYKMPDQNEDHLTGKMLYERGNYFYHKAKKTHTYGGLLETDMAEMEQAGSYYSRALAAGYRPENGYGRLEEYYLTAVGDEVKQEAGLTALIEAYPDNSQFWYSRAMNRKEQQNYREALQDLNQVLRPGNSFFAVETAYYMRGAIKYMLNPQDTMDAEADRSTAQKLHKETTVLIPYQDYCKTWK